MSKYRNRLPQLGNKLFLTDGGMETTLIFHEGIELPYFAGFDLLKDEAGMQIVRDYYDRYLAIARQHDVGALLESPTWRANADWAAKLGYDSVTLADANRKAIGLMLDLRAKHETRERPMVISGNIGPRGDGYRADARMTAVEACRYHAQQIDTFAGTDADMVSAFTINYPEEAIGVVQAARAASMPVAISFTVETNGCLSSGDSLATAIQRTDAETGDYAAYFMINCAHPSHFEQLLQSDEPWRQRIRGLRANASRKSHAELDESTDLDSGDPQELGSQYRGLRARMPRLNVLGGCCGTDHRHVAAIFEACA
ncbi:MAG: homocysteine S-methyltransferase family protein [Betaproteobacteria bacterium]